MAFLFNPCQPCCTPAAPCDLITPLCCPGGVKRGLKVVISSVSGYPNSNLDGAVVYLNYNELFQQWDGYTVVDGDMASTTTKSTYVSFLLACVSGVWEMVVVGRSTTLLSPGVNGSQMALYTVLFPSVVGSYASQGAFVSTSQSTSCSPFSQTHNFTSVSMNIDGSTTTGIAFTATVTEQSCAYQGRIAEYGTGNFVIPDVLTATITSSGCGLVGDQIILVRDYLTAFTWTGTLGTKNAPKSTGNMFQVRLQMVNMNGVGSVRSKFILFVMNTGGVPQCGECWVFVDTFNLAAVPASSGTDTPFLLTFPNIVTGTRLSDGSVSLGDCICLSGVSSMTIAVTAYASQVCCSGTTPSALFVTLGSTETTSLSLAKRTTLGDWYSATSWTNVSHQTVRSVVNFFCQNSAGTNNFNAHVASWIGTNSIRESIFYQNFASNNTPPVCSPFLALLQPAETGAACFVYAYNLITVSE